MQAAYGLDDAAQILLRIEDIGDRANTVTDNPLAGRAAASAIVSGRRFARGTASTGAGAKRAPCST